MLIQLTHEVRKLLCNGGTAVFWMLPFIRSIWLWGWEMFGV